MIEKGTTFSAPPCEWNPKAYWDKQQACSRRRIHPASKINRALMISQEDCSADQSRAGNGECTWERSGRWEVESSLAATPRGSTPAGERKWLGASAYGPGRAAPSHADAPTAGSGWWWQSRRPLELGFAPLFPFGDGDGWGKGIGQRVVSVSSVSSSVSRTTIFTQKSFRKSSRRVVKRQRLGVWCVC